MPKRIRPYGSADDAEAAALARGRPRTGGDLTAELAGTMMAREIAGQAAEATRALSELTSDGADSANVDDVRDVIASLERMSQDLPPLCEQRARILGVQREDEEPWILEAVEALAAAGRAADMMTAALAQARKTSARLG